jgi:hypothetical protein
LFELSIALFVASCSHNGASSPDELVEMDAIDSYPSKNVSVSRFNIYDSLFFPKNIWISDTVLVMQTEGDKEIFRLYSLSTGEKLRSFGNMGRAGNEYISPEMFQNDSENMIVSDRMKFDMVNIPALLNENRYTPVRMELPVLSAVNFIAKIDDSNIVFNSGSLDNQLNFVKVNGDEQINYNKSPQIAGVPELTDFVAQTQVFRSVACYNGVVIFMGYAYYPILDIVDPISHTVKRISFPIQDKYNRVTVVDKLNSVMDNRYYCYNDICVTDDYLYLLYFGAEEKDLESLDITPEIHKFDLDGNLKIRYILDMPITKIAVSENNAECYAIGFDANYEDYIVKFPL